MRNDLPRKETLEAWIRDHGGLLSKIVRAWARSREDRDDLVQEIGLQLWDSIPRFEGTASPATWVYRVALYAAMAWSRRERRHSDGRRELDGLPSVEVPGEDPRVEWLYGEIARLNPVDRSLAMLLLEGWSYSDMADSLGISEKNVSVRIHRIKRALAERFPEGGSDAIR